MDAYRQRIFASLALVAVLTVPSRAQFIPGAIFSAGTGDFRCELDDTDYVRARHPLGWWNLFALNGCPYLSSNVMSPDGKHLRVVAGNWGAILEFDSEGNWEVVIDTSDGVIPQTNHNSIAYDREGNFYVSGRGNIKVMKFPADGAPPEPLAYYNNNGVILEDAYGLSVGPSGEVYVANRAEIFLIAPDGNVSLFDTVPGGNEFIYSMLVDEAGYVHAQAGGYWYRYLLGDPSSRMVFAECVPFGEGICGSEALAQSPDRTRIYTSTFDYSTNYYHVIAVDPHDGSYEIVIPHGGESSFTVVPLRGDVDGDSDTDINDLEWLTACMDGPDAVMAPACDLADMDADGDVDLFDVRYFELGYTAFAEP